MQVRRERRGGRGAGRDSIVEPAVDVEDVPTGASRASRNTVSELFEVCRTRQGFPHATSCIINQFTQRGRIDRMPERREGGKSQTVGKKEGKGSNPSYSNVSCRVLRRLRTADGRSSSTCTHFGGLSRCSIASFRAKGVRSFGLSARGRMVCEVEEVKGASVDPGGRGSWENEIGSREGALRARSRRRKSQLTRGRSSEQRGQTCEATV